MTDLVSKQCVPCHGGVPPLAGKDLEILSKQLPHWKVVEAHHVSGFQAGAHVCESRGRRGEEQGHHPDILLGWGKAEVTTWTDKIDGLTDSQQAAE